MGSQHVIIEDHGTVRWMRLARPERRNAISLDMYAALARGLEEARAADALRVVVLTGEGEHFSSGNDLKDFLGNPPMPGVDHPIKDLLGALARFDKPLISAVDGVAVGIGFTVLLLSDFVLVTERARLRAPFVNLAVVPEAGSSLLLPMICGHQRAAEIFMLGDFIDGPTAHRLGLANDLVAPEALRERAEALARRLAAQPIGALVATKRLLRAPYQAELEATMAREAEEFIARIVGPEATEAFTAFLEKRAPDFSRIKG